MNQNFISQQLKKVFTGELILSEGKKGAPCMFIIKEGFVEIFIIRDENRIVLSKLGKGASFGEMGLISSDLRNASAKALTYCELYVVDDDTLKKNIDNSPVLIRHIVKSLIGRVKSMVDVIALNPSGQSELVSYAHVLELMSWQFQSGLGRSGRNIETSIPIMTVIEKLRAVLGNSENRSRAVLKHMEVLQMIRIESGRGNAQDVHFHASNIVERANKMSDIAQQGLEGALQSEIELVEIDELAQIVGVDRKLLLAKLAADDLIDELFVFRKSLVLRLISEKGRDYFKVHTPKKPQDISDVGDLDAVDQNTLFEVVNHFDVSEIAMMIKVYDSENVLQKIYGSLSKVKQAELREACANIQDANLVQADQIKTRLMASVRQSLLGQ